MLHFQHPHSAFLILKEAIDLGEVSSARQQAIFIVDSALALVQQEEIEEACQLVQQAVALTLQTKSGIVMQRIHTIQREMKSWEAVTSVKILNDQLATHGIIAF